MKKQKSYIWILSILSVIGFVGIWWFCCDVLKLTSSYTSWTCDSDKNFYCKIKQFGTGWCHTATAHRFLFKNRIRRLGTWSCDRHTTWNLYGMV